MRGIVCQETVEWTEPPPLGTTSNAFFTAATTTTATTTSHHHQKKKKQMDRRSSIGINNNDNSHITTSTTTTAPSSSVKGGMLSEDPLNSFKDVLKAHYPTETDFDATFFEALKQLLWEYTVPQMNDNIILLGTTIVDDHDHDDDHGVVIGIGLVRQMCVTDALRRPKSEERQNHFNDESIRSHKYQQLHSLTTNIVNHHHAVCLLSQQNDKPGVWNVLDCFAVVEFQLSRPTSICCCCDDDDDDNKFVMTNDGSNHVNVDHIMSSNNINNNNKQEEEEEHASSTLAQAIAYTIGSVYLFHARRGKLRNRVNKFLPVAMMAARKDVTTKSKSSLSSSSSSPEEANGAESQRAESQAAVEFWKHDDLNADDEEEDDDDNGILEETTSLRTEPSSRGQREIMDTCRWVSGRLTYPEVCGSRFSFAVQSFGGFYPEANNSEDENVSVANALSLYFDTMHDGLKVAREVMEELAVTGGSMPSPDPPSGLRLCLGTLDLNLQYCASPIYGANAIQGIGDQGWKVSQGDLFQGRLDIRMIRAIRKRRVVFAPPEVAEVDVVVKVSFITMTHTPLVHPERTFAALQNVQVAYLEDPELLSDTVNEIGTVLYAGFETEVGIVLIMSDLSKQEYTDLQPQQYWYRHGTLEPLWGGFVELVKTFFFHWQRGQRLSILTSDPVSM